MTIYHQPKSFVALGAVAKSGDVLEATGLDLAQAIACAGWTRPPRRCKRRLRARTGVRSPPSTSSVDARPQLVRHEGLRCACDQDVIYVANASAAELQVPRAARGRCVPAGRRLLAASVPTDQWTTTAFHFGFTRRKSVYLEQFLEGGVCAHRQRDSSALDTVYVWGDAQIFPNSKALRWFELRMASSAPLLWRALRAARMS